MFEDFLIKYAWSAFGLILCSFPTFVPSIAGAAGLLEMTVTPGSAMDADSRERMRTGNFITNKRFILFDFTDDRLMLSLADAGGRLLFSYKDLAELAGYTSRIYALLSTLHRVHADAYFPPKGQNIPIEWSLADIRGTVQEGFDGIRLEGVPIVAPAGQIHATGEQLIDEIDMIVHEGEHTIISGPNGVGKSSVARVVAGLWPVFRGLVSKPKRDDIFYIPQRPYLSMGTLRDQIIYPDSHADMVGKDISDADLEKILETVKLEYIPSREGGWETRKEWKDVFSGGEKQRVGMARMFYHQPRYAILDEATSAVSQDVEALMYEKAKAAGISISIFDYIDLALVTISHRPTLLKYHQYQLRLGTGDEGYGWELQQLSSAQGRMTIEKEIAELEEMMKEVDGWKARREEIETALTKAVSFKD
jgi:ATP-binding cassette subfamily D (ALD) long-chain fatty acid import protein